MGRYYGVEGEESKREEVYTVSEETVNKIVKRQHFKPQKLKANKYEKDRKKRRENDPYPGKKPVNPESLEKHQRGQGVDTQQVKTKFKQKEQKRREDKIQFAEEQSARTEIFLNEDAGFLEGDSDQEFTAQIKQEQIKRSVDEISASKRFDLNLTDLGPYKTSYSRHGKHLLLGGRRGHVAAFDWNSKNLKCEINVMESVHDVKWINDSLFGVAQKKWTYVYDTQGIEIHCLKKMDHVVSLDYLPYHYLLVGGSERGGLTWLDVSVGKIVAETWTRMGNLEVMCQNPATGVMMCGHGQGTVTMWTPGMKECAGKMLTHQQAVRAVAADRSGNFLATSSTDRTVKIWDLRTYNCLHSYKLGAGAAQLQFSQTGLLGLAFGNRVEIYKNPTVEKVVHPYMKHQVLKNVTSLNFCPYEDVLGVGHGGGFTSMLVPGSGEPNFDALEANPYQTVKQRQESEVKSLLDKIPFELISVDREALTGVDAPTLEEKIEERNRKLFIKPMNIEFDPRQKMKGKQGSAKRHHIKRTVVEQNRSSKLKNDLAKKEERREGQAKKPAPVYKNVLDRFK